MAKSLRLVAAQLSDVGRRRERNQDNVTHVIPADPSVLEEKGALFVVCDGMGGHAAGEVAAELGVNTVRDGYYAARGVDVVTALAQAVDQANQAIYRHAREHPELTGMGTTCVAVALVGGRAYFINIGDSRGYLLRDGNLRQVTRDHSWVAEQVRVGVLSAEQARTHLHRNVITRSLGTQPTVTADFFIESVRDGDRVLLCSDGLHGYVEEDQMRDEILRQDQPEVAVKRLIDLANANGGPDNITAVVVHLLQVPEATGDITLPMGLVHAPAAGVEAAMTQPLPMQMTGPMAAATSTGPLNASAGAAVAVREETPAVVERAPVRVTRRKRSPAARLLVVLAALIALVAAGGAVWYLGFGPNSLSHMADRQLQSDITNAQQVIQRAPSESPAQALADLATARNAIEADLQNGQVDPQVRQQGTTLLNSQLEPAVRTALQRYNAAARVVPVTASALGCTLANVPDNQPLASITSLAAVPWTAPAGSPYTGGQLLYVLHSGQLYQAFVPLDPSGNPQASNVTCHATPITSVSSLTALASDGATLYALASQSSSTSAVLSIATVNSSKSSDLPGAKAQTLFTTPTTNNAMPTTLAADGSTIYVSYTSTSGAGIWIYTSKNAKWSLQSTVQLARPANSLAGTGGILYVLLNDGTLGEVGGATHQYMSLAVDVLNPVQPADPNTYAIDNPVPTPQPTQMTQLPAPTATAGSSGNALSTTPFPLNSELAVYPGQPSQVLVGDATNARVVGLNTSSSGPGAALHAQFVYGAPSSAGSSYVAAVPNGSNLLIFAYNGSALEAIVEPQSAFQS